MASADYSVRDGIALVTIDNPPVNAMTVGVPRAVCEALERAGREPEVVAIVIRGGGSGTIAGADIRMFGKPWPAGEPSLRDIIATVERSPKPVAALIRGQCLGGGLELALSCHYRLAASDSAVGQPEVKLGFPPGAGGTQRLPRLAGVEAALAMILDGNPVPALRARDLGIIDRVVEGDPREAAIAFMRERVAAGGPHVLARDRKLEAPGPDYFAAERTKAEKANRNLRSAQLACIDCVEAAVTLPFDAGIARERAIFETCLASEESRALRHVFFAERAAGKVPGIGKQTAVARIASAAVIGSGTMGTGIAMCFAEAGIPVHVLDTHAPALERGIATIRKSYEASAAKGRLSAADVEKRMSLITPTSVYADLAGADIAIEAVFEDMPVKRAVFAALDRVLEANAILASNTSYLDVDEIAASVPARLGRVLGLHFFSPANLMRLLEIVRTSSATPETVATALALARRLRKLPVVAGVCHGFIGNRMLTGYIREAGFLLEEGASPQQVDKALTDFGMPMGPFAVKDLAGLDIGWRNRKAFAHLRDASKRTSPVDDWICELGRFGQKTGAGYYRYEPGSRAPIPDPLVDELIRKAAKEKGITRREIGHDEIVERCLYPLVNEGAKVLEEGIALRASDIDLVWINGYGFPAWRGGPMHWADTVGLAKVLASVERLARADDTWEPAPLLKRLATERRRFADLDQGVSQNA